MNKTFNINLGGIPFQIDDVAFDQLSKYLNAVKRKFSSIDGQNEIVEDIEARMAEMFQEKLKANGRSIIGKTDVDSAISTMGKPEEFEQGFVEEDATYTNSTNTNTTYRVGRKLYRDTDDKVLGGVISGLTKYFGFGSPTWFRVGLFILPFVDWLGLYISTGLVIITYIILWIVVPKAKTSTQKMEMRGEPVNLDNIERSFSDGVDNVKKNLNNAPSGKAVGNKLGHVVGLIAKGFLKLLLFFGLAITALTLIGFVLAFLFGIFGITSSASFLTNHIFGNGWMSWLAIIGLLLISIAPLIFLITLLVKLLFKTKTNMPAVALSTLGAFILGLIFSGLSLGGLVQDFSTKSQVKNKEYKTVNSNEIIFLGNDNESKNNGIGFPPPFPLSVDDYQKGANLTIKQSVDSTFSIEVVKKARGRNTNQAEVRASEIDYEIKQNNNQFTFDSHVKLNDKELLRDQYVVTNVRIPENMIINFDPSMAHVLRYTWRNGEYSSNKLVQGKRWKMFNGELINIDSEGNEIIKPVEEVEDESSTSDEHVEIKLFGEKILNINVTERGENGEAEQVTIDLGGDRILDVNVNKNGERIKIQTQDDKNPIETEEEEEEN